MYEHTEVLKHGNLKPGQRAVLRYLVERDDLMLEAITSISNADIKNIRAGITILFSNMNWSNVAPQLKPNTIIEIEVINPMTHEIDAAISILFRVV